MEFYFILYYHLSQNNNNFRFFPYICIYIYISVTAQIIDKKQKIVKWLISSGILLMITRYRVNNNIVNKRNLHVDVIAHI